MDLRVAQLIETLGTGGAEKLAVEIARARAASGDDSHLIILRRAGDLAAKVPDSVSLHVLGLDPGNPLSLAGAVGRLTSLCRHLELDALQTHLPLANFFGLTLAWRGVVRVFPTVHNNREFSYGNAANPVRRRLRRWAYRRLTVHGAAMIAVSDAVKAAMAAELGLQGRDLNRLIVVPNGVVIPEPTGSQDRQRRRREFGVEGEEVLIVGVGRLSEQKNFGDLLMALASLGPGAPAWRCVIAGGGPQEMQLRDQAGQLGLDSRLTLAGRIDDVNRLLAAGDIFCLPSLWEGLPLALLEAMAAGLPVAAYGIDGVKDVITDGRQGLLVPTGDHAGLGRVLERLMADGDLRRTLGREARQLVKERHGMERVNAHLGRIYAGETE
ncbi:glycosyltransferase [bacterium]|nr:glycosyltransferase [bacterium]